MQVSLLSLHDYGNIIFALCIEEESGFLGHFRDVAAKFGLTSAMPESGIDRRELIVAYLWLAQHMLQDQGKLAGELEHHYVTGLQMHHLFRDAANNEDIRAYFAERAQIYEHIAKLSPNRVDLVDVSQPVCRNVFRNWSELEVHLPRLGMIMTHLMTEWIVTVTRTIDELNGTPPQAAAEGS